MTNGLPFAPMIDAQAGVENLVKRHLQGIMHAMGPRYAVSLVLDDRLDASNAGVLNGPSADLWRAAVAVINAAAKHAPLDEDMRQKIGKALGLQATVQTGTVPISDFVHEVNQKEHFQMALLRLQSFTDENGKAIIRKALGGDVVTDAERDEMKGLEPKAE